MSCEIETIMFKIIVLR